MQYIVNSSGFYATYNTAYLIYTPEFSIVNSMSPALIRNSEGDNLSASGTTTLIEITGVSGNTLTLNVLPENLINTDIDWFIQSLDSTDYNSSSPSYNGDYTRQNKIISFDFLNDKITITSSTGFTVGKNICLYSPWANYEFLPGQESAGVLSAGSGWMNSYVSSGPVWYDASNEKYMMAFGGRTTSHAQVGIAFSTDLSTWTIGNGGNPIILNSDHANFTTHVLAGGNIVELDTGRIAFTVTGYNGTSRYCHIIEMDKDASTSTISISDSILPTISPETPAWYSNALVKYNDQFIITTFKSNAGALETWTNEMWTSDSSLLGTYTKTCDILTTEYNSNDSVWLEGHADALCPFVENGSLYMLIEGTQRYTISGIQGNRVMGLMAYDDASTWSIVNNFAPEIIFPMYFYNIVSENYDWAGGHLGGNQSFIKTNGKCYLFGSFLYTSNSYQVGALELINRT